MKFIFVLISEFLKDISSFSFFFDLLSKDTPRLSEALSLKIKLFKNFSLFLIKKFFLRLKYFLFFFLFFLLNKFVSKELLPFLFLLFNLLARSN